MKDSRTYDTKTGGRAFVNVTVQVELEYARDMPEDNNHRIEMDALQAVQAILKDGLPQKSSTTGVFAVAMRPTKVEFDLRMR